MGAILRLKRSKCRVALWLSHGIHADDKDDDCRWFYTDNIGNNVTAELMRRQLQSKLDGAIADAQREAYNQGWKDAKAKRGKQTHFSGWVYE